MFTYDGKTPYESEKVGPYSTKLKAKERNSHVLNHILFWADILSQGTPNIELKLDFKTIMTIEKLPQSGIADFAIIDDPAIYEEEDDAGQTDFFDILFGMSRDGDEYEF